MHSTVYMYCVCTTQRPVHIHCTDNCNGKIQIHCDIMFSNMLPIPCAYDCIYVVHSTSLRIKHFHGTIMHIVIMHVVHHIQMVFSILQFALVHLVNLVHHVHTPIYSLFSLYVQYELQILSECLYSTLLYHISQLSGMSDRSQHRNSNI